MFENLTSDNWVAISSVIVTLLVFIKAIAEYQSAQKWKKAEFLAQEIKAFRQDIDARRAMLILDWEKIKILTTDSETLQQREIDCTDDLLFIALSPNGREFTPDQQVVRTLFDQFLDRLGLFERYKESELVTIKELKPYLQYWITAMCNANSGPGRARVIRQLWRFIDSYDYASVRNLCEAFGAAIPQYQLVKDE